MKKVLCSVLLLFSIVVISCSNEEPMNLEQPNNENQNEHNDQTNDQNEDNVSEDDETNGSTPDDDDSETPTFSMADLRSEDLKQGVITGLPFAIGDSFDILEQDWGIPVDEDYLRGGKFHSYHVGDYYFYFFDPDLGEVTGIQINPNVPITLDRIRDTIGDADFDELDDMLHGTWSLTYQYDDYTVFFVGKTVDENSDILYMFLKPGR